MPAHYLRLSFQLVSESADLLAAALWERGTLGVEQCDATRSLVAYFPIEASLDGVPWQTYGGRLVASDSFAERDWLAGYRRSARPITLGRRLVVDPGEPVSEEPEESEELGGRRLLRLPARTAFGTGSHATTRLAVELMDEIDLEGLEVLDVGFGSGVLSFAAELAGAARVVGVEIDAQAALVAAQNRVLNSLYPGLVAGGVAALRAVEQFDLALVNVLPERIEGDLGAIRKRVRTGGTTIFSGILTTAAGAVLERLQGAGFEARERRDSEEWSAFRTEAVEAGVGG
jgi:ribosomal protein L11 methyltransferase